MPYISAHAIVSQKHPDLYFHFLAHPLPWAHCLCIVQIHALKLNPHEVVFKGQTLGDTRCREWNLMIGISVLIKEVPESCLALLPCDGRWLQLWKKQSLTNTSSAGTLVLDFPVSRAGRHSLLVSISSPVCGVLWQQSEQPPPPFIFPFFLPSSSWPPVLPLPDTNISIQTPQMSEDVHYWVCEPGSFHGTRCFPAPPIFFIRLHSLVRGYHIFFIHPYADGLPGWPQNLAVVSSATHNKYGSQGMSVIGWLPFLQALPGTDMAASSGSSIKTKILKPTMKNSFLRKLH